VGRHRHVVNVRADGIAVVLGPLLRDQRIVAAALVDVESGMVLDAWSAADAAAGAPDLELIGAQHAEIVRNALELLRTWPAAGGAAGTCEVVLGADDGCRHLLRTVPDPYGDRLALAVVLNGPQRVLDRVRKRLQAVSVDALTAGPSMTRRPSEAGWSFDAPAPDVPAHPGPGAGLAAAGPTPGSRPPVEARSPGLPAPRRPSPVPFGAAAATREAPGGLPRPAPPVAAPPTSRSDVIGPSYSSGPAGGGPFASAGIRPIVIPADAPPPRAPTSTAADEPRPPSPPAALPAPAPPRSPRP
jgi:hypothetical protein